MEIPKWLNSRLDGEGLQSIEEAVRQAELKTSGEIVPLIVRRCSTVGHIPLTLLLFLTTLWLILIWTLEHSSFSLSLLDSPLFLVGSAITLILLTRFLSPLEWVERTLTPRQDQAFQVNQRAEIEFFESQIKATQNSTGILLMLSLMERRAVVLADKSINDKLPPETWQEVIHKMTLGIHEKNLSQGVINGIQACSDLLAPHFPIQPDDINELPNHLIIKDN